MDTVRAAEDVDYNRRRVGAAAMTAAATQLGLLAPAHAQPARTILPAIQPGTNVSFGPLKQINAGVLSVGYAEAGPADGPVVISCTAGRTTSTVSSM